MECERCKFLMEVLTSRVQMSINPPIIMQLADQYYNKDVMDKLIKKEARGYWQKLWDAILGR